MLAAALWAKDSPVTLTAGDGALIGAFTGLFGAAVHSLVNIPLAAVNAAFFRDVISRLSAYTDEMPSGWEQWFDQSAGPFQLAGFFLGLIVSAAVFCVLGVLGGILGVALFGKKTPPSAFVAPPATPPPAGPAV
jgi:hypothetical protein